MNRHRQLYRLRPKGADIVAKVENRTTRRISVKSILGRACCRKALRRQYEGRWSFWYETMWSLHVATRETHQRSLKFSAPPGQITRQGRTLERALASQVTTATLRSSAKASQF